MRIECSWCDCCLLYCNIILHALAYHRGIRYEHPLHYHWCLFVCADRWETSALYAHNSSARLCRARVPWPKPSWCLGAHGPMILILVRLYGRYRMLCIWSLAMQPTSRVFKISVAWRIFGVCFPRLVDKVQVLLTISLLPLNLLQRNYVHASAAPELHDQTVLMLTCLSKNPLELVCFFQTTLYK